MQNAITIVSNYFQNLRYGTFSNGLAFFYKHCPERWRPL